MRHLAARMHARIGTAGDGQRGRLGEPQRPPEGLLDRLLDGGQARLAGPAVERRAVVGQSRAAAGAEASPAGAGRLGGVRSGLATRSTPPARRLPRPAAAPRSPARRSGLRRRLVGRCLAGSAVSSHGSSASPPLAAASAMSSPSSARSRPASAACSIRSVTRRLSVTASSAAASAAAGRVGRGCLAAAGPARAGAAAGARRARRRRGSAPPPRATSSITASAALSPLRGPTLVIRV